MGDHRSAAELQAEFRQIKMPAWMGCGHEERSAGDSQESAKAPKRTWHDSTGSLQADLIGFDGSTLTLSKADGKVISVPLDAMSKDDRAFVMSNARTDIGVLAV